VNPPALVPKGRTKESPVVTFKASPRLPVPELSEFVFGPGACPPRIVGQYMPEVTDDPSMYPLPTESLIVISCIE